MDKNKSLLPVVIMSVFLLVGCGSILEFTKTEPPPAPKPPVKTEKAEEYESKLIDAVGKLLYKIYEYGISEKEPVVKESAEGMDALETSHGSPSYPLPLIWTGDEKRIEGLEDTVEGLKDEIAEHRVLLRDYKARLQEYRTTPVESGWSITSGLLRLIQWMGPLGVIIAVALLVFFPSIAIRWVFRLLGSIKEISRGIRRFMDSQPNGTVEELKNKLSEEMNADTKRRVGKHID